MLDNWTYEEKEGLLICFVGIGLIFAVILTSWAFVNISLE